jgi:hypothetical protein
MKIIKVVYNILFMQLRVALELSNAQLAVERDHLTKAVRIN